MNAHLQPFAMGGKYFSFYPYYVPGYYSNYYPRHFNRYYQPVSQVTIKKGPITVQHIPEPKMFQSQHYLVVVMVMILFIIAVQVALK